MLFRVRPDLSIGALIYQLPTVGAFPLGALLPGAVAAGDLVVGERVNLPHIADSNSWIALADGAGYVWQPLVEEVEEVAP